MKRFQIFDTPGFARLWTILLVWFAVWSLVGFFVVGLNLDIPGGATADMIFMGLAASLILMETAKMRGWRTAWLSFVWVAVFSGAVEIMGAVTGFPFGVYHYTDAFGLKVFGILPLTVPLAWWIVVQPMYQLADLRFRGMRMERYILIPFLVSTAAVWVDLLLEPVAWLVRGYWIWEGPGRYFGVPSQNFAGWFGTAFIICLGLLKVERSVNTETTTHIPATFSCGVLAVVILTFCLSALMKGYILPTLIGMSFLGFLVGSFLSFSRRYRSWVAQKTQG